MLRLFDVQIVRKNGSPYRHELTAKKEKYVNLPHESTYVIELINRHVKECDVNVQMDGKNIGDFRVGPRSITNITRTAEDDHEFMFIKAWLAGDCDNAGEGKSGLLRAEFAPSAGSCVEWNPTVNGHSGPPQFKGFGSKRGSQECYGGPPEMSLGMKSRSYCAPPTKSKAKGGAVRPPSSAGPASFSFGASSTADAVESTIHDIANELASANSLENAVDDEVENETPSAVTTEKAERGVTVQGAKSGQKYMETRKLEKYDEALRSVVHLRLRVSQNNYQTVNAEQAANNLVSFTDPIPA